MTIPKEVQDRLDKFSTLVTEEESWAAFNSLKDKYKVTSPRELVELFQNGGADIDPQIISKVLLIA